MDIYILDTDHPWSLVLPVNELKVPDSVPFSLYQVLLFFVPCLWQNDKITGSNKLTKKRPFTHYLFICSHLLDFYTKASITDHTFAFPNLYISS